MADVSIPGPDRAPALDALGDVLQALARSSFEIEEVLQTVIERAVRLCHANTGDVAIRDGDGYRVVASVGMSEEAVRLNREQVYVASRGSVKGRALLEGRTVQVADVLEDPEYALLDLQRAGRFRTVLGVPLIQGGEVIGALAIHRTRVAPYGDEEVALVSLFADQAAIAIRIANLLAETRQSLERERAIGEVLQTISRTTFDLDRVLQTVIRSAVELSRADFGNILRFDESTGFYQVVAHHGEVDPAYLDLVTHTPYKPDRGTLVGRTLVELRPVHIVDTLEDPEYRFWEAQRTGGYRTILGVPIMREGSPIGIFAVWRREVQPFSEREITLLTTFADQAALAMENVRLFQTVERQRTELARFAPQVASLLSSDEGEQLLAGHRREISALFCDLRGFTAFAETAEPEEVLGILREYHAAVGELAVAHSGTIEHFAGDGLMVFFNDPAPVTDHETAAVRAALAMRDCFAELAAGWRKRGYELGLGIGIAVGYASLGRIGFEGRYDYGGVGNVVILASRLSDAARDGQVLVSQRLFAAVEEQVEAHPTEPMSLKGFSRPVPAYEVHGVRHGRDL
jgi:class 3 adenylate cyclase